MLERKRVSSQSPRQWKAAPGQKGSLWASAPTGILPEMRPRSEAFRTCPFEPLFSAFPIRHHPVEEFQERRAVMGLRQVAELVGDHVVDGVVRCLNQTAVEQQSTGRRPGSPPLSGLADDARAVSVPYLHQLARYHGPVGAVRLHDEEAISIAYREERKFRLEC